jgi:hypothetical protein
MWVLFVLYTQDSKIDKPKDMSHSTYYRCLSSIGRYSKLHPGVLSGFPPTETVDITDRLDKSVPDVRVMLKNNKYSLQYDAKKSFLEYKGVPSLGFGAYFGMSLDDYKNRMAMGNDIYNSPDLDSHYDGIGDEYYQIIIDISK